MIPDYIVFRLAALALGAVFFGLIHRILHMYDRIPTVFIVLFAIFDLIVAVLAIVCWRSSITSEKK